MHDDRSSALLIRGGSLLGPDGGLSAGDVWVEGGRIAAIGGTLDDCALPPHQVIDAARCLVAPGLVNAHTHSPTNLTRGTGERLSHPAFMWLNQADTANRTPREIRVSALVGCIDMLLTGTTAFIDHFPEQNFGIEDVASVVDAYRQSGMRVAVALRLFDGPYTDIYPPDGTIPAALLDELRRLDTLAARPAAELIALTDEAIGRFHEPDGRVTLFPAISNPIRCTDQLLRMSQDLAEKHDTGLHMHLLETRIQKELAQEQFGKTQIAHLDDLGLLTPRLSTAHTVWLDDADIALLAARGVVPVHNPDSNLKIGAGVSPVPRMLAAGVTVALGTDGASTAYSVDLRHAMRMASLSHRGRGEARPDWVGAGEVLTMATEGGARAMQRGGRIGRLDAGYAADLVLYDLDAPCWTPLKDALQQFVYGDVAPSVRDVIIDGRIVVRDRKILTFDAEAILAEARALFPVLQERNRELYAAAGQMAALVP